MVAAVHSNDFIVRTEVLDLGFEIGDAAGIAVYQE
jgi:hypothetical protein